MATLLHPYQFSPRVWALVATLLFALTLSAAPVSAATIEVSGDCTLAEAIANANNDNNGGGTGNGCAAGSGDDTITLTADIDLSAEPTAIASNITIEGNNKTIDGKNLHRILRINSGTVRINNLTLRNGRAPDEDPGTNASIFGGAIRMSGATVTISKSSFIDNVAPGDVAGCASNFGGAIISFGNSLTILDSVFRGNRATNAAAVFAGPTTTLTIERSSFTGHGHPVDDPAGCSNDDFEVIRIIGSGSVIRNVTVSGNSASGMRISGGTTTISHSTIVNNKSAHQSLGGGLRQTSSIHTQGRANLYNNIIAFNTPYDCHGTDPATTWILAKANNLIEDDTCSAAHSDDPKLALFRGSPGYHPLWAGSPAIDTAPDDANCADKDIRGVSRPVGSACDLGAYEGFIVPEARADTGGGGGPLVYTGEQLLAGGLRLWAEHGLRSGIQFQRRTLNEVGIQSLIDEGVLDAVDVWGYAEQDWEVCFPQGGAPVFLDAAGMPRVPESAAGYSDEGYTCVAQDRAGMVVLQPGSAPAAAAAAPERSVEGRPLDNCMVRTKYIVNFRETPGGALLHYEDPWGREVPGWLPWDVTLTALERRAEWYRVDYYGTRGWVSADYVTELGDCT